MITYTDKSIWPPDTKEFTAEAPTIADIAVGLGRQSRFAGQTQRFYTVLCHVLVGAELIDFKHRIHWLLHDAPEAIVSDVPTTWKHDVTVDDEAHILRLICSDLGIDLPDEEAQAEVKRVDFACLRAEAHALGHTRAEEYWPSSEFDDLTARAFDLTMLHLQHRLPMQFLHPESSIPSYSQAVAQALGVSETDGNIIVSINEALK